MGRQEPKMRISERALTVWKLYGWISAAVTLLIGAGLTTLTLIFDWSVWFIIGSAIALILEIVLFVFVLPTLKWKRWRYEVREEEIELQHGIFIVTRTLVPMVRVQHVETEQGPILRKYRLATVSISTAATLHQIPALDINEADALRDSISALARVAEDDV
ncbi:PH domain-containing protein [Jeotgalibacillus terrae]|uniref:PH domain-containing protein n=1 Tax=Jeotgalibacillus terrae TaxID=587735 RepID=A0ABW5ZE52_9BACL|nr:PH domain-containing protein [Jeotgalibacillus terrae]MBM7579463.1 membrane protein YdbS with pleckstrin-like domain [Jeotgalibacillus terrae]